MATKSQWVQVGRRKLELSNLEKVLYPGDGILKAEVIAYYHEIAPTILYHIKGRPLTLIRFPDGIESERFYQKNRPRWAPDWVEFKTLGEEKKDYILATEQATLLWLAMAVMGTRTIESAIMSTSLVEAACTVAILGTSRGM
jgi:DNA primase